MKNNLKKKNHLSVNFSLVAGTDAKIEILELMNTPAHAAVI